MTKSSDLAAAVALLPTVRLLCIGDVMLDRFIYGSVERISPEAPIPVFQVGREQTVLGGAGNVVRNLAALGCETCFVSVVGDDGAGREITRLIGEESRVEPYILVATGRQTTIKERYVAAVQQILRADRETIGVLDESVRDTLLQQAMDEMEQARILILSDYGKGVLSTECLRQLIEGARRNNLPMVVDPKGSDFTRYAGATVITPNRKELAQASRMEVSGDDSIIAACRHLIDSCDLSAILATRSQDGMTLVTRDGLIEHLPAEAREVYDVAGAGDTVVAVLSAALAAGRPIAEAARLANVAAGVVVGKVGTAVAHSAEIVTTLHNQDLVTSEAKTLVLGQALEQVAAWRRQGLLVGFTNGCFDLLHPGHVSLLAQARAACDRLVVGLNSDASVRRLKGPDRPIQSEAARSAVLGSLSSVDAVVIFGEETPIALIDALRPDLLVKGADYRLDQVVGGDLVQAAGGRVMLARLEDGHSTSNIVSRLSSGKSEPQP